MDSLPPIRSKAPYAKPPPSKKGTPQRVSVVLPESQDQILVRSVLHVLVRSTAECRFAQSTPHREAPSCGLCEICIRALSNRFHTIRIRALRGVAYELIGPCILSPVTVLPYKRCVRELRPTRLVPSRGSRPRKILMAPRTYHTTRISSAVASPPTTNHAAKRSVFVNLKTNGNLKIAPRISASEQSSWVRRSVE